MKNFKFIVYKEDEYFVSQCLNVDISSFGDNTDEAIINLKEALELYYQDEEYANTYMNIEQVMIGETVINA